MCYQKHVLQKHQLQPLSDGRVACTKKCYEKALKSNVDGEDGRKGGWFNDGIHGPDDPNTSMKILLDWWMEYGNYSRYCGKNNDGVKKKRFCDSLAEKMSKETLTNRDSKSVKSKIEHIERAWRKAHEFATSVTGAGIQEQDGVEKFEELVKKKCFCYYDLLDIMQDRASSKPKVTNYDLEDDDDILDGEEGDDEKSGGNDRTVSVDALDRGTDDMSAVSEASKSILSKGSKRPPSSSKSVSKSVSSAKKARVRKSSPTALMDDDISAAMNEAATAAHNRLSEMQRHNKALEDIEKARYDLERKRDEREALRLQLEKHRLDSMSWKSKSEELEYQMKLVSKYHEIRKKFHWSDKQIVKHFPSMKQVIDNLKEDSDSNEEL